MEKFREHGWSKKAVFRQLVTRLIRYSSETYVYHRYSTFFKPLPLHKKNNRVQLNHRNVVELPMHYKVLFVWCEIYSAKITQCTLLFTKIREIT